MSEIKKKGKAPASTEINIYIYIIPENRNKIYQNKNKFQMGHYKKKERKSAGWGLATSEIFYSRISPGEVIAFMA